MSLPVVYLNSNDGTGLVGIGEEDRIRFDQRVSLDSIQDFIDSNAGKYVFLLLSYDLKNSIEDLDSNNFDGVGFPVAALWTPSVVFEETEEGFDVLSGVAEESHMEVLRNLEEGKLARDLGISMDARTSKDNYLNHVKMLKDELQQGNIYEVNYCQEFYAEDVELDNLLPVYNRVNRVTKAPFSCYVEFDEFGIISGSPERFVQKVGSTLLSQPIKGTIKRGSTEAEDKALVEQLQNDPKEKAENVMIVDLVRNDLSRIAQKGSVKVDELFGIYSFETVHQMISTVSCGIDEETSFTDVIKALFPMGSMTGAPKISSMNLIEKHEDFKRGIYSGSVGYIDPNGDFDLNVIIRTLVYNRKKKYLSCGVGGAITIQSIAENEYEECLTKVNSIMSCLND
jgi:para-aminobenzoate synthetase component 1